MNEETCQNWFAKISVVDSSLNDVPQVSRQVKVHHGDQIKLLFENNQHYTR